VLVSVFYWTSVYAAPKFAGGSSTVERRDWLGGRGELRGFAEASISEGEVKKSLTLKLCVLVLSLAAIPLSTRLLTPSDVVASQAAATMSFASLDDIVWEERSSIATPEARLVAGMAYDSSRNVTVLFGGHGDHVGYVLGDTWKWNGSNWVEQFPSSSPSARYQHILVYDSARGVAVLFGGLGPGWGEFLGDTWEYNGTNWSERNPINAPSARDNYGMTYDSVRERIVLFGGRTSYGLSRETWEYDGTNWMQQSPTTKPSARALPAMVYDEARERIVLFGGLDTTRRNDTWEYDGTNWVQLFPANAPPARYGHTLIYDSIRKRAVLFGGFDGTNYFDDAWEWDGTDWTQLFSTSAPSARAYQEVVYDNVRGRGVLFGGRSDGYFARDDTWEYYDLVMDSVFLPMILRQ